MTPTAQRIYDLIPAIYRIRDAEQGEPLKELVTLVAEQAAVIDENLEQLYDDQFIETCAEWVLPYIGDLIGHRQLHGEVPAVASPRAEIANTIAYRRRKGTAAMLEQLTRDVTGWNARVVEFFQLLATTQYMNHLRPANRYSPDLRKWEPLERLGSAFDTVARTIDTRSPDSQAGRYNIPNIGIFLWRLNAYSLTRSPAPTLDGRRFFFSPLAHDMALFTRPEAEKEITHLAEPTNVPAPISRNVLANYFDSYYGERKSLYLWVDNEPVGADNIEVCNLADFAGDWAHSPQESIAFDPLLGRIALHPDLAGVNERQAVHITGFTGDSYSLEFDGQETDAIDSDAAVGVIQAELEALSTIGQGNVLVTGDVTATDIDIELDFVGELSGTGVPAVTVDSSGLGDGAVVTVTEERSAEPGSRVDVRFHYGFSADMGGGEYERAASFEERLDPDQTVGGGAAIQPELDAVQAGGTVQIEDSGRYRYALAITAAAKADVELRSANEHRATLLTDGPIEINGGGQSTVILNGLLISGGPVVVPAANNNQLKRLILRHCTLVPGLALTASGDPRDPGDPSLIVEAPNVSIEIDRCIVGAVRIVDGAEVDIRDSIVDANDKCHVAYSNADGSGPGAPLRIVNSTVIGKVHTREMMLASNAVFDSRLAETGETWPAPTISEKKQSGCMRFCYVPVGSRVPRRYRCQPDLAVGKALEEAGAQLTVAERQKIAEQMHMRIKPVFTSRRYATPGYCQLSSACPPEIGTGADDESEMGAFHDLYQPQREANLRLRLDEYLRFGLQAGIIRAN